MFKLVWLFSIAAASLSTTDKNTIADAAKHRAAHEVGNLLSALGKLNMITLGNQTVHSDITNIPWAKGDKAAPTYKEIMDKPADYCAQCVFSGGKWKSEVHFHFEGLMKQMSSAKAVTYPDQEASCTYESDFAEKGIKTTSTAVVSKKLTYKDMFDGLADCASKGAPTILGQRIGSKGYFQTYKAEQKNNCDNSFSSDDFDKQIPTHSQIARVKHKLFNYDAKAGNNFTFTWGVPRQGDWCYLSQALPAFSGGLWLTHTLSSDTEFALRIKTGPQTYQYYNHTSINLNETLSNKKPLLKNNASIPILGAESIEIYYRQNNKAKANDFKIAFERVTDSQIAKQFQARRSIDDWIFIGILVLMFIGLIIWTRICKNKCWGWKDEDTTDFYQESEDNFGRV